MVEARGDGREGAYLDHAATSPLRREAWEAMAGVVERGCYNPASVHAFGRRAHRCLEEAREELAGILGAERRCIVFTGGGTHSDNLAVLGFVRAHRDERPRLLVSEVEHKAVLEPARRAGSREEAELHMIPVDATGTVELAALEETLARDPVRPTLVSVMWANNEVGTVQPVAEVCEAAHRHGALFHTDAVQGFGKLPVSVERVPADLLTVTAHKIGGPVGIGALYLRDGMELEPLIYGGAQERALWPGTQNPAAAAGFAAAARLAGAELEESAVRWMALRDGLAVRLREAIPDIAVHAESAAERMPNLLSVGLPGCDQASLLVALDLTGVAVSGGSACSSGAVVGSHVLRAMGVAETEEEYAAVRFSFGHGTSEAEVERAAVALQRAAARLRPARGAAG